MAAEAEATREARAKVIAAEGEQKASGSLREAAEMISSSPAAIQLRFLQTLNGIASEKNSTVVVPIPVELIRHFFGGGGGNKGGGKKKASSPAAVPVITEIA
jgi:erythrocyte band 7 integral membrane protein